MAGNSRSRATYRPPRSFRCPLHRNHPSPPLSPTPPPSPTWAPGPPLRPTRVVFGMKKGSPAVMLASVPINTAGLVTDADFRANGWDVYRLRDRSDGDRVYAEINARNPERAIWRAEQFKDTDGHFEDMFDMEAMFDVDDKDDTDVEEEPVEEKAVEEKAVEEKAVEEKDIDQKAADIESQPVVPASPVAQSSADRTDGEAHERRYSMMGRGRVVVPREEKYRHGDAAQHLGHLRGTFK